MQRLVTSFFALVFLAIVYSWFTSWAWNTCQPLDKLFARSGCVGTLEVKNFSPLLLSTMAPAGADEMGSLFGWEVDDRGDRTAPKLIRLNPETGQEEARFTLSIGTGFDHAVFSIDGQKALLTCSTRQDCAGDGSDAAIVSIIDGTLLTLVDKWDLFPRVFPGDPLAPDEFSDFAMITSHGGVVIDEDDGRNIALTMLSTGQVVQLAAKEDRRDNYAPRFSVSPDQTRVAMVSTTYGRRTIGDLIQVWDIDGRLIFSLAGSPDYRIASNAIWSHASDDLFILREKESSVLIDRFIMP